MNTKWIKTKDLSLGMNIAVADVGNQEMFWDEIVSIERVGRERVWDIEVEGTRNFVGNQIIAHNTYINGNVGIGNTSPVGKLDVSGAITGKALTILNETGDQNILAASASGTTVLTVDRSGNITNLTAAYIGLGSAAGRIVFTDAATDELDIQTANLDLNTNLILNVGNAGTDFTAAGGLTLAGALTVSASGADITGNVDVSGTLTSGTANAFTIDATGNISSSGTTGLTLSGNAAKITFSGTGPNEIVTGAGVDLALMPGRNVGIGTTAPLWKLHVSDSQAATASAMIQNTSTAADGDGLLIKLGATTLDTTSRFITFLDKDSTIIGKINAANTTTVAYSANGTDMAEYFVKDESVFTPGDIVSQASAGATLTTSPYDPRLLGIVSSAPSFVGGTEGPNKILVAIVGQVPVKIASSSAAIQPGDLLTSSSAPGRAIKAAKPGFIIGKALQSWDPSAPTDMINVYISNIWADPHNSLAFDAAGNLLYIPPPPSPELGEGIPQSGTSVAPTVTPSLPSGEVADQTILTSLKVDQSAEIGIDLRVLGQLQVEGALTVIGDVNFLGRVFFNKDTAGFAAIPTGARSVTVNYDREYLQPPIVTTNPVWDIDAHVLGVATDQPVSLLPKQDYIIAASSTTGFTLLLEQPAVVDLKFSWTAIAVKDPRTIMGIAPTPPPLPTSTPTPTFTPPEPTLTPTPTP